MPWMETTRLRRERVEWQFRAAKKFLQLRNVVDRTREIAKGDILVFATVRNEHPRLPFFMKYYRDLGANHFFFVDNDSTDGTREYLTAQEDASVWTTTGSYKRAKFGMDWLNALLNLHAHDHWVLVVDVDEFFVYPKIDTRPLRALTDWLDASRRRTFGAMLIDMYSKSPITDNVYQPGDNPFDTLNFFDSGNYVYEQNHKYFNLWIQGGPRQRVFFSDQPELGPALNKIPLVKWTFGNVYISSTHTILPRGLNRVYDQWGGEKASGCLLHAKFLSFFADKAEEELDRGQHYAASREYRAYQSHLVEGQGLWTPNSTRYTGWKQLENLGLISSGGWL
ncbi:glycosyltransferase family 2 protein [Algicella marina]|uniref:Glycosyltransferase family 2 protein n=1 Tax=Algicella marina TaxID=2683284 RepID=A0A6P1T1Q7_9RHOB|nr:glycosyltransferase family 2 protein [Algicella marina]QHQ36844.1 glycosyltransferase family 2 protein [Algicella marina]